ncbi:hypothetical protein NKJ72_10090 [Mesorhizobium sp. M0045]|uniref:hypothetical protein n=1 Tax=unclassified Mesorhizobium TaxID=325217 RepID=UPI00333B52D0
MSCDHGAFVRSRGGRLRRAIQAASGLSILALAAGLKKPDLQKVKQGNRKLFLPRTARLRRHSN